jgi:L-amino acid N-acyltransferase YncA
MRAVLLIYSDFVLHSCATFEEEPPTLDEMLARRANTLANALPFLVAEIDGQVGGFAYLSVYRPRSAYRFTVETSIYIAPHLQGRGLGVSLLGELMRLAEAGPWHETLAIIGDSNNQPSIRLHQRLGFRHVGTLENVGYKHRRWIDAVIMQRTLKH